MNHALSPLTLVASTVKTLESTRGTGSEGPVMDDAAYTESGRTVHALPLCLLRLKPD